MTDIDEQQPDAVLKGAEYVEYLGLYFNREKEAAAAIQHIVDNFMCTQKAVEGVQENAALRLLWARYGRGYCADGSSGAGPARRRTPVRRIDARRAGPYYSRRRGGLRVVGPLTCRRRSSSRPARPPR